MPAQFVLIHSFNYINSPPITCTRHCNFKQKLLNNTNHLSLLEYKRIHDLRTILLRNPARKLILSKSTDVKNPDGFSGC